MQNAQPCLESMACNVAPAASDDNGGVLNDAMSTHSDERASEVILTCSQLLIKVNSNKSSNNSSQLENAAAAAAHETKTQTAESSEDDTDSTKI